MQNAFAAVDVERARIKIGFVGEIKTQAPAAAVSITAAVVGCPGRIDSAAGRVVWVRSELEFLESIPLAARLGTGRDCTTELLIHAAPHWSARKSRFQITRACALAGSEMLNACVLRAC